MATSSGFSLHAGVAMAGNERDKIEKLCAAASGSSTAPACCRRYIARPPVALERLHLNQRGEVVYVLKKPYSDGTTHIVMTPLEFIERLAGAIEQRKKYLIQVIVPISEGFAVKTLQVRLKI